MRFMTARDGKSTALYAVRADKAYKLSGSDEFPGTDLWDSITGGDEANWAAETIVAGNNGIPLSSLKPALPFNKFGKILCLGLNYVDHVKEGGYEIPTYPALFIRLPTSMLAADEPIVKPLCSDQLDYEVELMVILGKGGRHIQEDGALDHVFGYTLFNDGSVRDYQRKTHQWAPGKNFDKTGALGPVVVTPDELPQGAADLTIQSRLNGKVMQKANTSDMMWSVARTIATLSEFTTLEPGDLIAMGTPPGVGHAQNPPAFMFEGDVIEVEIESIGICRNPVINETVLESGGAGQ